MARPPKAKRRTDADGTITVSGKRGNGAGTIFYETDRKRWRARFVDPITGKRHSVTAPTQEAVLARQEERLGELAAGLSTVGDLTPKSSFGEVATRWLETVAPIEARPNTLRSYAQDVRRLSEQMGGVPIGAVDSDTAQAAIGAIREHYGYGTTRNARARLAQITRYAIERKLLSRAPTVRLPKRTEAERAPKRTLAPTEVGKLLAALDAKDHRLDAAVAILFTAGIRASEALGLAWTDVDLDAGTAEIVRGCTYTPATGCTLDRPKTTRTEGTIRLHPRAVELLRTHRARQAAERIAAGPAWLPITYEGSELEMVFVTASGTLQREQAVGAALSAALVRAGLPPSTSTHMGRRSVITALAEKGVPLDDVADFVGHSSTETTRRYVQSRQERSKAVAAIAHDLFATEQNA